MEKKIGLKLKKIFWLDFLSNLNLKLNYVRVVLTW